MISWESDFIRKTVIMAVMLIVFILLGPYFGIYILFSGPKQPLRESYQSNYPVSDRQYLPNTGKDINLNHGETVISSAPDYHRQVPNGERDADPLSKIEELLRTRE